MRPFYLTTSSFLLLFMLPLTLMAQTPQADPQTDQDSPSVPEMPANKEGATGKAISNADIRSFGGVTTLGSFFDGHEACMLRHDVAKEDWLDFKNFVWSTVQSRAPGGRVVITIDKPTVTFILGNRRGGGQIVIASGEFQSRAYNPFTKGSVWHLRALDKAGKQISDYSGTVVGGCPWYDQKHAICAAVSLPGVTPKSMFELIDQATFGVNGGKFRTC